MTDLKKEGAASQPVISIDSLAPAAIERKAESIGGHEKCPDAFQTDTARARRGLFYWSRRTLLHALHG